MTVENNAPSDDTRVSAITRAAPRTSAGRYISGTSAADVRRAPAGRCGKTSVKCSSSGGSSAIATASPQ